MSKFKDYLEGNKKIPIEIEPDEDEEEDDLTLHYDFFDEVRGDPTVGGLYNQLQSAVKKSITKNLKKTEYKGKAEEFFDSMYENFSTGQPTDIDELNLIILNVLNGFT